MSNKELRSQAWAVFRDNPMKTVGLSLMLVLPAVLCAVWVALVYGAAIWQDLFVLYTDAAGMVRIGVTHGLTVRMLIPYVMGMFAGVFFVGIVAHGLWTGYVHCLISLCRGEKPGVRQLGGRLDTCLKVLGLQLLIVLKALVWIVPFAALAEMAEIFDPTGKGLLQLAQVAAAVVPTVKVARMVLNHALAVHVMAEEPETTISTAIRRSKAMMQGSMWRFIRLHVPYVLWSWAATGVASTVITYVPSMQISAMYLTMLVYGMTWLLAQLAGARFYVEMKPAQEEVKAAQEAVQEPEADAAAPEEMKEA